MTEENTKKQKSLSMTDIALIPLFSAIIALCAWITVPIPGIPFTMQVFGVFVSLAVLGAKKGLISIAVYILLGAAGVPVFAGFKGGIGVLLGSTGGYIAGFIISAAVYAVLCRFIKNDTRTAMFLKMAFSQIFCYLFGSVWYLVFYTKNTGPIGFFSILMACVIPYIVPDLVKIALAVFLGGEVRKRVKFLG